MRCGCAVVCCDGVGVDGVGVYGWDDGGFAGGRVRECDANGVGFYVIGVRISGVEVVAYLYEVVDCDGAIVEYDGTEAEGVVDVPRPVEPLRFVYCRIERSVICGQ
jgi:hypothetical protein